MIGNVTNICENGEKKNKQYVLHVILCVIFTFMQMHVKYLHI